MPTPTNVRSSESGLIATHANAGAMQLPKSSNFSFMVEDDLFTIECYDSLTSSMLAIVILAEDQYASANSGWSVGSLFVADVAAARQNMMPPTTERELQKRSRDRDNAPQVRTIVPPSINCSRVTKIKQLATGTTLEAK